MAALGAIRTFGGVSASGVNRPLQPAVRGGERSLAAVHVVPEAALAYVRPAETGNI
jgi:hypothetical protein